MVVVQISGQPAVGQLWVEAGIMKGGIGNEFKCAILIQDYASLASPARWFGELPLDPTDQLYMIARGAEVYTVRLTALVEHRSEG